MIPARMVSDVLVTDVIGLFDDDHETAPVDGFTFAYELVFVDEYELIVGKGYTPKNEKARLLLLPVAISVVFDASVISTRNRYLDIVLPKLMTY